MKKILFLSLMFSSFGISVLLNSMENDEQWNNNGWYLMICEAIAKYNGDQATSYTYENVSHVKRTGPFWPSKDHWAYDGYNTGQYLDINKIDCNRKRHASWDNCLEIQREHVYRFWHNSPKIAIRQSLSNEDCIKVEIDTTEYDNNLLKRRPWYQKPVPVLCLATPLTFIATWYLKTWWDLRK